MFLGWYVLLGFSCNYRDTRAYRDTIQIIHNIVNVKKILLQCFEKEF